MRTFFTNSSFRTFVITFAITLSSITLLGQTRHSVAVTDNVFTPAALTVSAGDTVVWTNTGNIAHNVNGRQATYPGNPTSFGNNVGLGWTYEYIFNTAGVYNYRCDPHFELGMVGSVTVNPALVDTLTVRVNFTAMTPHVGQPFYLAVIDSVTQLEVGRVKQTATEDFSMEVSGLTTGASYWIDFWADHNGDGLYDAPPVDHAWRLMLNEVESDTIMEFVHNTNFTDIAWKTKLTVHFTEMTPHLGQTLTLYLRSLEMGIDSNFLPIEERNLGQLYESNLITLDTVIIEKLDSAEFDMSSWMIRPALSYTIDIWADHNSNGTYDAPPVDHAWRLMLNNVVGDTIIEFIHNTDFFDISLPTPNEEKLEDQLSTIRLYPNPANQYIDLLIPGSYKNTHSLKVYSVAGVLIDEKVISGNIESYRYDISRFKNGIYFMEIKSGTAKNTIKFLKQ